MFDSDIVSIRKLTVSVLSLGCRSQVDGAVVTGVGFGVVFLLPLQRLDCL